jgi:hypothetical protein
MNYEYTIGVLDDGWHELCRIRVRGNRSLFNAVHAVIAGDYGIFYDGQIILTQDITPVRLGMNLYLLNHVVIRYDSDIEYPPLSGNTDSEDEM